VTGTNDLCAQNMPILVLSSLYWLSMSESLDWLVALFFVDTLKVTRLTCVSRVAQNHHCDVTGGKPRKTGLKITKHCFR
jgi:hypothetical protein